MFRNAVEATAVARKAALQTESMSNIAYANLLSARIERIKTDTGERLNPIALAAIHAPLHLSCFIIFASDVSSCRLSIDHASKNPESSAPVKENDASGLLWSM
jgi:hypothetical protein